MWPGGNDLRHRRHARGDTRPKGGALQSRRSTCDTESTGQTAASCNAGGWPRRRLNAHCTASPYRLSGDREIRQKCQLARQRHMSARPICRKLDCAGVSRPGPEKVASGGPGCSRYNRQSALPPCGREGLVLGRLAAFGAGGHTRTVAAVRALAARTGETTESARPCTPLWRLPRARSTSSSCPVWWIRQTRPLHRRPNLSPL